MLLSPILDTGISFIFFYFTLSTLASTLNEWWLQYRQSRGKLLKWSLEELMNDPLNKNFSDLLYNHPFIDLLKKKQTSYPPFIPNDIFTKVLIDLIADEYEKESGKFEQQENGEVVYENSKEIKEKIDRYKAGLDTLHYSDFKKWLETFSKDAKSEDELEKNISTWFNHYMDQVKGWFKIKVQKWLFIWGLVISIVLNINAIKIANSFWQNHQLRSEVTMLTEQWYEKNKSEVNQSEDIQSVFQDLKQLIDLPLGWSFESIQSSGVYDFIIAIIGWMMSALFISFGAPLWFEILGKIMSVKSSAQKDK
ncbi:MAG: hypothetical protein KTR26_13080 [Flammeovirgaceae bacterium]|nr:hypothetical protein [Flammeovirgaceae bacterium]